MEFCKKCRNMYSITIDENDQNNLYYICNYCGDKNNVYTLDNCCVSKTYLKKNNDDININYFINEYTKYDPTLPRINNILCPNKDCATNTINTPREIIYIRYDETNLKYIYLCSTCDYKWKMESTK